MTKEKEVFINTDTIELDKFLKWAGVFSTGGEAKLVINEGRVKVNGQIETHRSRKLKVSDIIEVDGLKLQVCRR
ncbi:MULTISPECIES: RNA-binding S4 domain-containing protein [Tepidanaerobacter]|uniref:Ribosome-associated protein n=1 Tax=Tepidanaerobacter syntrophicus TaxID=224999 RepID=A0A0U9HFF7_9FIRM|nr:MULTISPECIES: RNA-binding S4 domain-containing protein [Tepidanaerobacter]GAQ24859.1 ribosome-associated protein [Tepidanaerobacter syntrophicus]GLI18873.1 RNA-binding protein S4 [Tepidanaerobacter syntrophicus]GLI51271.1 RNA-binding protein S4 [Tepidanaerobacter syntrophicus]HHV83207.1 RNA-binding S4 domain-containing protein [Tepidanaerobacter syntrophicus]